MMADKTGNKRYSGYEFSSLNDKYGQAGQNQPPPSTSSSNLRYWLIKNKMLVVTLSGVVIGLTGGSLLRPMELSKDTISLIAYPGEIFIRFLKMMILPLIFSSLITGTSSLDAKMNGRIAFRTVIYFTSTNIINVIYGVCLAYLIHPGDANMRSENHAPKSVSSTGLRDSLLDMGRNFVPENLFQAMFQQAHTVYVAVQKVANVTADNGTIYQVEPELVRELRYRSGTNTLGLVFFCITFGSFLGSIGPKGKIISNIFAALFEVSLKIVITLILYLAPLGISSIIAEKILIVTDLVTVVSQLAWFAVTVIIGLISYQLIGIQLIYFVFMRKNPYKFYSSLFEPILTAFATSSSAGTLPVTFRVMENSVGVDTRITRFILPIGATINTDGTAYFLGIATMFIVQMNGMLLGFGEIITLVIVATLVSMSGVSVPSGSLVMIHIILNAINVPTEYISLLFAIDWLLDRIRTTNNILSDCYAAAIIENYSRKELKALDEATAAAIRETHGEPEKKFSLPDAVLVQK